jgi:hypothetical protein
MKYLSHGMIRYCQGDVTMDIDHGLAQKKTARQNRSGHFTLFRLGISIVSGVYLWNSAKDLSVGK